MPWLQVHTPVAICAGYLAKLGDLMACTPTAACSSEPIRAQVPAAGTPRYRARPAVSDDFDSGSRSMRDALAFGSSSPLGPHPRQGRGALMPQDALSNPVLLCIMYHAPYCSAHAALPMCPGSC